MHLREVCAHEHSPRRVEEASDSLKLEFRAVVNPLVPGCWGSNTGPP